MLAFEAVEEFEKNQSASEKKCLAITMFAKFLIFVAEELQSYNRRLGFQMSKTSEQHPLVVVIVPNGIDNLNDNYRSTKFSVDIEIENNSQDINEALFLNLETVRECVYILKQFAEKQQMKYNTKLGIEDFNSAKLQVDFERVLADG